MLMKKFVLLLGLLGFCFASQASIKDSIGLTKKESQFYIKYFVSPGETIYGISTQYGVPISTLMEVNEELDNGLKVGQIILIPYDKKLNDAIALKRQEERKEEVVHVVKPGETLFSLSRQYDVEIGQLLKWNGMELKAGQKLVVGHKETNKSENSNTSEVTTTNTSDSDNTTSNTTNNNTTTNTNNSTVTNSSATSISNSDKITKPETDEIRLIVHNKYDYDPTLKQVLIVPFDPHLYFSDADDEIAAGSKLHRTQVRNVFRKRLNALLDPEGYETIHLLGGDHTDTLADLNKIYQSVSYGYQDMLYSNYLEANLKSKPASEKKGVGGWMKKQLDRVKGNEPEPTSIRNPHEGPKGKYFGVKIRDPKFFDYFNQKYSIDYYVFINQFEVVTDYEHCLDRATNNFSRYFVTHFSIFTKEGEQIAGNKFKVYYNSSTNYALKIVADNMPQVAQRVMAELPPPSATDPEDGE